MKGLADPRPDLPAWVGLGGAARPPAGDEARDLARALIPPTSKRWRHVQTAAAAAADAAQVLTADEGAVLVSAAWLHDIGYYHPAAPTGFHPLDGAQLVRDAGWSGRIAALVAHHSQARFMADARGLRAELEMWPREEGLVADGLAHADMTSAPGGGRIGLRERLLDVRRRHAAEAPDRARARRLREPYLVMAAARVDIALVDGGHCAQLALPVRRADLHPDATRRLALAHPGRATLDVRAAVHASASMVEPAAPDVPGRVLEGAHRLLLASQETRWRGRRIEGEGQRVELRFDGKRLMADEGLVGSRWGCADPLADGGLPAGRRSGPAAPRAGR